MDFSLGLLILKIAISAPLSFIESQDERPIRNNELFRSWKGGIEPTAEMPGPFVQEAVVDD